MSSLCTDLIVQVLLYLNIFEMHVYENTLLQPFLFKLWSIPNYLGTLSKARINNLSLNDVKQTEEFSIIFNWRCLMMQKQQDKYRKQCDEIRKQCDEIKNSITLISNYLHMGCKIEL